MRGKAVKFETVRGGIPKLSIEFSKGTAGQVAQFDGLELEISEATIREAVPELIETEAVQALKRYLSPQALAEYEAYVLYLNKKAEQ